ncbi:YciI family protein [Amycolatopsis nigrescens]|uniref:YciI family protein n=1 Tax=Amycolatopsis nigrescens TaxID=381445 RepID=UPI00036B90C3|nr:YciI family protein [Amycolatopsis nigrescens]
MRFMILIKATGDTEGGAMPSTEQLEAMGKYNAELVEAGVMVDGAGLHPSSKGAKVKFSGKQTTVVDGPFAESKELIAGFWMIEVDSLDEAIDWVRRCPSEDGEESEIEIRQVFEAADFGDEYTPELREADDKLREQIAEKQ